MGLVLIGAVGEGYPDGLGSVRTTADRSEDPVPSRGTVGHFGGRGGASVPAGEAAGVALHFVPTPAR